LLPLHLGLTALTWVLRELRAWRLLTSAGDFPELGGREP
jgi:hypothetical protein